jgi:DNA adenine methylase
MKPLFMWAGGKTSLIKVYAERGLLPEDFDSYLEPFLGAGAMFVWAYEQNPHAKFYLNDLNQYIMGIYRAVQADVEKFCEIVDTYEQKYLDLPPPKLKTKTEEDKTVWVDHPTGSKCKELEQEYKEGRTVNWTKLWNEKPEYQTRRAFYFSVRQRYQELETARQSTFDAATLYFLMKTGFNGVWQTKGNTDIFNTPCGLMRHTDSIYDKENVMEWHTALQGVTLLTGDFAATLAYAEDDCFIFMDPPYRGCFTQYGVDFDDNLQQSVVDYLNNAADIGAYAIMSNRDVGDDFFQKRQGTNIIETFDVTYTVGRRKKEDDGTYSAKKAKEILMIGKK